MSKPRKSVRVDRVAYGRGVFATRDIAKGEQVGVVSGRIIDDEAYWSSYCIDLGGELSLEPRSPFRYLNHSCEPNCQLFLVGGSRRPDPDNPPNVVVVAVENIRAGEELRIDYAWNAEGAIPCLCGSPRCRGWVVAENELPLLRRRQPRDARQRA